MQGGDVNSLPYTGDDSAMSIFDTTGRSSPSTVSSSSTATMALGDEAPVASSADEADENQGGEDIAQAIGMKLAAERKVAEIVKLTGASSEDEAKGVILAWGETRKRYEGMEKQLSVLQAERDAAERATVIEQGKREGKLTPTLLSGYLKDKSNDEMRAFLKYAPVAFAPKGGQLVEPAPGGEVLDFSPEEAVVEQLIPGGAPKQVIALRQQLAPSIREGAIEAKTTDAPEFHRTIEASLRNPTVEPYGWMPRSALRANR